jgi:hypothetical protein
MKKLFILLYLLLFSSISFLNAQQSDRGPVNGREDNFFRHNKLFKGRGDNIYIVIDHKACLIPDKEVFNAMGLDWNDVRKIDNDELTRMEVGSLIFRNHAGNYFVNLAGRVADIGNESMFHALDLDERFVVNLHERIISKFPSVRLVIAGRNNVNYLVDGSRIYEMSSDRVLKAFGLYPEDVVRVHERVIEGFQITPLLLKGRGDRIYLIEDGKCRWITSPEAIRRNNLDINLVMHVEERTIKEIPEGRPIN